MNESVSTTVEFAQVGVGKRIGDHLYLHISVIQVLPAESQETIAIAATQIGIRPKEHFNVVKLHKLGDELSLLHYPDFFEDPFPALAKSWRVSLSRKSAVYRTYEESRNPPILHRKELLLPPADPRVPEYAALTETAESIGLFADPNRIGFREYWYKLIAERGYVLENQKFIPLANVSEGDLTPAPESQSDIRRHLTALTRSNFSAPVQALSRHGLINAETTFFDYGCGKGDDVRGLIANGIDATGWDPHYAPEAEKRSADAVNIGFVINVIENLTERVDALKGAFAHARGVLSIAAMLSGNSPPEGRQYGDGYLSSRNTFQKYFTQAQLRDFIEHTLDENAIAAGPGVFFVFRDKELEQRFLSKRYGHRTQTVLARGWVYDRPPRELRVGPPRERRPRVDRATQLFEENRTLLEALWLRFQELGRPPEKEELDESLVNELELKIGSLSKALRIILGRKEENEVEGARAARSSDLLVLFALQQFQKRKPYRHLEPILQRDIRYFFGNYLTAQESARQVLYGIGNLEAIDRACRESAEKGYGWLEEGQSLQLHASLLQRLPTLLRVYVECATVLCGDISEFDLIKIHIRSGKISLMKFEAFESSPLPRLQQRIKVKLREQDMDVFSYGQEFPSTLLYRKSRYINEEFPRYSEQLAFEEALDSLDIFDLTGYGPSEENFFNRLSHFRWQVEGFKLIRSKRIPSLDEPCGKNFLYRHLIECGDTQYCTSIKNLPKEADSYTALYELAVNVLDPLIEYYGMIKLTYGFCSQELSRLIPGRISPALDQHAAYEKGRTGRPICSRLGAAVDFYIEHENMLEVAEWIADNIQYDRLYFYGVNKPVHVSYSQTPANEFVEMLRTEAGRLVPRVRPKRLNPIEDN